MPQLTRAQLQAEVDALRRSLAKEAARRQRLERKLARELGRREHAAGNTERFCFSNSEHFDLAMLVASTYEYRDLSCSDVETYNDLSVMFSRHDVYFLVQTI